MDAWVSLRLKVASRSGGTLNGGAFLGVRGTLLFQERGGALIDARLDAPAEDQESGMGDHAVGGAQTGRLGFVVAQQELADLHEGKMVPAQGHEQVLHLICGR